MSTKRKRMTEDEKRARSLELYLLDKQVQDMESAFCGQEPIQEEEED